MGAWREGVGPGTRAPSPEGVRRLPGAIPEPLSVAPEVSDSVGQLVGAVVVVGEAGARDAGAPDARIHVNGPLAETASSGRGRALPVDARGPFLRVGQPEEDRRQADLQYGQGDLEPLGPAVHGE